MVKVLQAKPNGERGFVEVDVVPGTFTDENGDVWRYVADTDGNLHRWFDTQPPVDLSSAATIDIVTGNIQVPQTDFSVETVVLADDYSDGNQGLYGQWRLSTNKAWSLRLQDTGQLRVYVSDNGTGQLDAITSKSVYDVGVENGRRARFRTDFRHLGSDIEVDLFAGLAEAGIHGASSEPVVHHVATESFPIENLFNALVLLHFGSRWRNGGETFLNAGVEGLAGTVEYGAVTVGGVPVARFPNPVGSEAWGTLGTPLTHPAPYSNAVLAASGTQRGVRSGAFINATAVQDLAGALTPDAGFPPDQYPPWWMQPFTNGATGASELWVTVPASDGGNQWTQIGS
ncbi:MAG: hypothetical protein AAGA65_09175 [Actinomycetota bacterium]